MNVHDELIHEKNDNTPQLPAIINALKLKYEAARL